MEGPLDLTPDIKLSSDPGDDTARRFRYQWVSAAISCCMLLDETTGVVEIFCEHHEDVLVKFEDLTYAGLQIKTRESDQEVWKATDEAVVKSCCRFVKLDSEFPGSFRVFKFVTNHVFSPAKNSRGFPYLLEQFQSAQCLEDLNNHAKTFLEKISKKCSHSEAECFAALRKTHAVDDVPKLADIQSRLVETLAMQWEHGKECTIEALNLAARNLITECSNASSLAHEGALPAYVQMLPDSIERELAERINGKRLDKNRTLAALEYGLNTAELLDGDPDLYPSPGAGDHNLLNQKLDAGGFSLVSLYSAADLRAKAEHLAFKWVNKLGRTRGLKQYSHIRTVAHSEAANAFETAKTDVEKFGPRMLKDFRAGVRDRRANGERLFDASDAHLEGFAYTLTAECLVVWSNERPWEDS